MLLAVGRIGRPHGIKGDVTVEVRTDDPDARFAPGESLATDPIDVGPLIVVSAGRSGSITTLHFLGFDDRTAAESLRGTVLQFETVELPKLTDPNDFYDRDLIGLTALHTSGVELGVVTAILHAPAAPVLTVTRPDGTVELVPFVAAIVPDVDLTAGTLIIDPPDGMFV
ncbi:MAG: ribosome maturation factor RimM [Nakamurella sp.]